MDRVSINNAEIAYKIAGNPENPLVITLHGGRGFGDHASDFKAYSPLCDNFQVLSFDMRGHGESSVTPPFTFQQLTDDIDALRIHFVGGHGKVIILGGSFGGFLAQQYAISYPQHVDHLILRGTAPSYHHEDGATQRLTERLWKAPLASKEMLVHGVFDKFESDDEFRLIMNEEDLKTVFRAQVHNDLYSQSEKYFDYRAQLTEVYAPALVIVGGEDWICPVDESRTIAKLLPNATLLVVENANHSVHLEKNEVVLLHIRKFLSGIS